MNKVLVALVALLALSGGCKSMNLNMDSLDDVSNLTAECSEADFGAGAQATDVRAFVDAASAISTTAEELDAELLTTCTRIAEAFGAPPEVLRPDGEAPDTDALCAMVGQRLAWEIRDLAQTASIQVALDLQMPSCQMDAGLAAQCSGQCGPQLASGMPMAAGPSGSCAAACNARAQSSLRCSGGGADIRLGALVPPDQQWRIDRLRYVVSNGWPMLQNIAAKGQGVVSAGATVVQNAEAVVSSAGDLNVTAARCATEVSVALPTAVDRLQGSVSASASLIASIPE
jgi:hypothetical protein